VIARLSGKLVHKDADGVIVDCGGVGYAVAMSLSSLAGVGPEGSAVTLLVHTHLTQDALRLFGFVDAAERDTFVILIGTSGVGPKLALAVLSHVSPHELAAAVTAGDKARLTRIPGIGAKKAERLLVELKDRLPKTFGAAAPAAHGLLSDVISALENLGFPAAVAEDAGRAALSAHPAEVELATLVRAALQLTR
jgi:holliday junction DNA helicase RuvA